MKKFMIYSYKIISPEVNNFQLNLQIDGEATFYSLHETIQKHAGYQSHQLASFFIPNQKGKKSVEISLLDPGINGFPNYAMYRTKLSELIAPDCKQLLYTFDLFNDRSLILELTGIYMEKNLNEPLVTLESGEVPVQILEEDIKVQESIAQQEDEVFQDFGVLEDYTEIFGEMDPI
ncbi:MAG: hypothetical protein JXR31_04250 [Prolixibacteraceae bacterium]|nr:hypothetical protein [Prolixibacteraceae bacterium]MBN2773435.1 hypothetical protein [Prolixibacteraceae bacterium]